MRCATIALLAAWCALPFGGCARCGADDLDARSEAVAHRFFDALRAHRFAAARSLATEAMRDNMPLPLLEKTWRELEQNVGSFRRLVRIDKRRADGHRVYVFVGQYARAQANVKLVIDGASTRVREFFISGSGLQH